MICDLQTVTTDMVSEKQMIFGGFVLIYGYIYDNYAQ